MSLIAEVVAALNAVRKTADDTRLAVTQVAGYAERSAQFYTHAAQGTNHPQAQAAVTQMQAAQHRTNLLVAHVSKGVAALDEYIRDIAPALAGGGGGGRGQVAGDALLETPAGKLDGLLRAMTKKADDTQDATKEITKVIKAGFKIKGKGGPTGAHTASPPTTSTTMVRPPDKPGVEPGDLVGHLLIVTTAAVIVGRKVAQSARTAFRRRASGRGK